MSEFIFIADYFIEDFRGGAEFVNEELISLLRSRGHQVEKIRCADATTQTILENKEKNFILSNFIRLNKGPKQALLDMNYVLYEHDHKYLINRNPAEFPNFVAPRSFLVDEKLYEHANAVFCQSSIHKKALEANIDLKNVISLGASLWTHEFLENIGNISTKKTKKAAIIADKNPIKQQGLAEEFCNQHKIPYDLLTASSPLELAKKLSEYEFLVFFPGVLETFSRVAVEAKMVGCQLYTNKLLGVASEEWFQGDRESIIAEMIAAPDKICKSFLDVFKKRKKNITKKGDITVILNAYRRPYNLEDQIEAIRSQTIKPKEIWLWINAHEDNDKFDFSDLKVDRIFHNDYNWKFYGRFAAALLADTEYVAVFDDDTIPGARWFENCLETTKKKEGILGSAGILLKDSSHYMIHDRCGWPTHNTDISEVDLVGHAWFFRREWLQYLWREKPFTWENGEDIQFAYLAQKYGNIKTYCPPHPPDDLSLHGSTRGNELGIDEKATSNNNEKTHQEFFNERDLCIQNAIKNGWKTVLGVENAQEL